MEKNINGEFICKAKIKFSFLCFILSVSIIIMLPYLIMMIFNPGLSADITYFETYLFVVSPIWIICFLNGCRKKYISIGCFLTLTETGIDGVRKKLFSSTQIRLPMDKIDTVSIEKGVLDITEGGGRTVAVHSASGLVKFPWVKNADEFVKVTLDRIEEFKKTMKEDNQKLVSAVVQNTSARSDASAAAKIKELKELLDSELISQEEFDAKRKELLEKI